jgi:hypothetical protein
MKTKTNLQKTRSKLNNPLIRLESLPWSNGGGREIQDLRESRGRGKGTRKTKERINRLDSKRKREKEVVEKQNAKATRRRDEKGEKQGAEHRRGGNQSAMGRGRLAGAFISGERRWERLSAGANRVGKGVLAGHGSASAPRADVER